MAWSPDGRLLAALAVSLQGGCVYLFDTTTGQEAKRIPTLKMCTTDAVSWSSDGMLLAVSCEAVTGVRARQLCVHQVLTGELIRTLPIGVTTAAAVLRFSPHAPALLAFAMAESQIHVVDVNTGTVAAVLTGCRGAIRCIVWSPHSPALLASGSADGTVRIFNMETGEICQEISGFRVNVWSVVWSPCLPDFLATFDGTLRVVNTAVQNKCNAVQIM